MVVPAAEVLGGHAVLLVHLYGQWVGAFLLGAEGKHSILLRRINYLSRFIKFTPPPQREKYVSPAVLVQ